MQKVLERLTGQHTVPNVFIGKHSTFLVTIGKHSTSLIDKKRRE